MSITDRTGGFWRLVGSAVEGNGGAQTLTVRPDASEVWLLHWARAWHTDSGGARTLEWFMHDNVVASAYKAKDGAAVAANVEHIFYTDAIRGPLVLEYEGLYVIIQGTGVLATKYLNVTALVEVFKSPLGKKRISLLP